MSAIDELKALNKLSESMGRLRSGGRLPSPPAELPPGEAPPPAPAQPAQLLPGPTPPPSP